MCVDVASGHISIREVFKYIKQVFVIKECLCKTSDCTKEISALERYPIKKLHSFIVYRSLC